MLVSIVSPAQIREMVKLAERAPQGAFVEVGVFQGGTAWHLYQVAMKRGAELHLFDTFTGTPFYAEGLDHHKINGEFAAPDAERSIRKVMPAAQLYVGIYPHTHPEDLEDVAFIHCDCDQYESYRAVIDRLWPLVVPGGFLIFDDYPYLAGAKQAVDESFASAELLTCGQRSYVVKPTP